MVFRRLIFNALLVGVLAGLILGAMQVLVVDPIIFAAETFEVVDQAGDGHASHEHSAEAWAPEDGAERTFYTIASSVSAAIGFAAILLALMSQLQIQGITQVSPIKGIVWGLAGFVVFFAAPGIGLPPEIPGMEAAAIESRQTWWLLTVFFVGLGVAIVAFAPLKFKAAGVVSAIIPYIIGAPHTQGAEFAHPDPAAVENLQALHHQFVIATSVSNLAFWLVLGVACAFVLNKWVLNGVDKGSSGET